MAAKQPSEFSWSNARHHKMLQCLRLLYLHHYGSLGGHLRGAVADTRRAYLLKQLVTLEMILGSVIHEFAREIAIAIRDRLPVPGYDLLLERARSRLNQACRSSRDKEAFLRTPKQQIMLQHAWYGRELSAETVERIAGKLRRCLAQLCASAVWADLADCRVDDILIVDSLSTFAYEGTKIYAAPDLAYVHGDRLTIVDWKTGDDRKALEQILVYALFLRDGKGIPYEEGHWNLRIVNLDQGTDVTRPITPYLLEHATERMRWSIAEMRGLLVDPERNLPKPKEAFPLISVQNQKRCRTCNFYELCAPELDRSWALPAEEAA